MKNLKKKIKNLEKEIKDLKTNILENENQIKHITSFYSSIIEKSSKDSTDLLSEEDEEPYIEAKKENNLIKDVKAYYIEGNNFNYAHYKIVFKINDRDYKEDIFIPRGETVLANFKEFICEAIKQELLKYFKFM